MIIYPKFHFAFHFILSHHLKRLNELIKTFRKTPYICIDYLNLSLHFIQFTSIKFYLKTTSTKCYFIFYFYNYMQFDFEKMTLE